MYDRVQRERSKQENINNPVWDPSRDMKGYHDICHWGECAALIAEADDGTKSDD
jgi:hypothetical protein